MAAAASSTSTSGPVTYGLDIVCELEKQIASTLPKDWMEDMMFLKANNKCVPTGGIRKKTKEIHLHYGTGKDDDAEEDEGENEWRSAKSSNLMKKSTITESIGGLLRKLGEANYESVSSKLITKIKENEDPSEALAEFTTELSTIVRTLEGSHRVMLRMLLAVRKVFPSFTISICDITKENANEVYGMWLNTCVAHKVIKIDDYYTAWNLLLESYEEADEDDKTEWANVFETILKHKFELEWWTPKLKAILDNPDTPLTVCFKIEDYF